MTVDIDNALAIDGWTTPEELTWLAEQAKTRGDRKILEIGSYRGRSCRAMADNTKGVVYAVDTWTSVCLNDVETPVLLDNFWNNMTGLYNVAALKRTSLDAASYLQGIKFGMIFIDADHSYEAVKADILAWLPLLAKGGLLCGHDYHNECEPGVVKAVDELIPGVKVVDTIWYKQF